MALISDLLVRLGANTGGLESALDKAMHKVQGFASSVGGAGHKSSSSFGALGSVIGALAANPLTVLVGAAAAAGTALVGLGLHAQGVIEETAHLADQLGLTFNALVGMQHAGEMAGVGAEGMTTALRHFEKALSEANHGSAEANQQFAKLHLTSQQLSQMPLEEAFAKMGQAAGGLSSNADRVAVSMALAGKQGLAAVNAFKGGQADLAKFNQEAKDLGLTLSKDQLEAIEKSNQSWKKMSASITGIGNTMAAFLAPAVEKATGILTYLFTTINHGIQAAIPYWNAFYAAMSAVWIAIGEMFQPAVTAIMGIFSSWGEQLTGQGVTWENFKFLILGAFTSIQFGAEHWRDVLTLAWDKTVLGFSRFVSNVSNAFTTLLPQVFVSFGNFAMKFFENLSKNISENWNQLWIAIQSNGKDGGKFVWHNLAEGFDKAMQELAAKSEAPMTAFQKQLNAKIKGEADKLGQGWWDAINNKWNAFNAHSEEVIGDKKKIGNGDNRVINAGASALAGSQEAFKILADTKEGDKMYAVANDNLKEAREHNKKLDKLLNQLGKGQPLAKAKL